MTTLQLPPICPVCQDKNCDCRLTADDVLTVCEVAYKTPYKFARARVGGLGWCTFAIPEDVGTGKPGYMVGSDARGDYLCTSGSHNPLLTRKFVYVRWLLHQRDNAAALLAA